MLRVLCVYLVDPAVGLGMLVFCACMAGLFIVLEIIDSFFPRVSAVLKVIGVLCVLAMLAYGVFLYFAVLWGMVVSCFA